MEDAILVELKLLLKEKEMPYFTDEELRFHYNRLGGNLKETAYACCILKAEDTTFSSEGLNLPDTSAYFLRLARMYRPRNSGTLEGGY